MRERLGRSVNVRVRNPVHLDDFSEPQPDIAVLKRRDDFYRHAHPAHAVALAALRPGVADVLG